MGGLRGHGVPRATVIRDRRVGDSAGNQGGTPTRLASPFRICPGPRLNGLPYLRLLLRVLDSCILSLASLVS